MNRQRVTRRSTGIAALIAILVALLGFSITPISAQIQPSTERQLLLTNITPFVGPSGTFTVSFTAGELPPATSVSLVVYAAVESRTRLDRTIAGEQLGTALFSTPSRPLGTNASSAPVTLSLPINPLWPAPENGTVLSTAGVYPVMVVANNANGNRVASVVTHLLRLPDTKTTTNALAVGTIVRVDSTPVVGLGGAPTVSDSETDRVRRIMAKVDDPVGSPPLTLAATPFVLKWLAETDTKNRNDTNITNRQTLLAPFVPIDSGALVAANLARVIDQELFAGSQVTTSLLGVTPDQTVTVLDDTVTLSSLDRFAAVGAQIAVVPSNQIRSSLNNDPSAVLTRRFAIRSGDDTILSAIASDDATTAQFTLTRDPVVAAQNALAELAMLHFEEPGTGRGVAVALPAWINPVSINHFLAGLKGNAGNASGSPGQPIIDPVTLNNLLSRTDTTTLQGQPVLRTWTSASPKAMDSFPTAYEQAEWNLIGLRTTLPDDTEATVAIEQTILTSASLGLDDPSRTAFLSHANNQIGAVTAQIRLPESQTVTLTSRSGKIPLVLTNDLPVEAHVRVQVKSAKLEFPEGTTIDMVLAPAGTTRTDIAVTTRASGAFPLEVVVSSANGALPLTNSRISVRSTAISGWGLILSVGAGLFLLLWWARHWRSSRPADRRKGNNETPVATQG